MYLFSFAIGAESFTMLEQVTTLIHEQAVYPHTYSGKITTHRFTKILFRYCQFRAWWHSKLTGSFLYNICRH